MLITSAKARIDTASYSRYRHDDDGGRLKGHPILLPAAWAAVILVMTSIPQPPSIGAPGSDKVAHFIAYLILGVLCRPWIRVGGTDGRKRSARALFAILLFAAADELHQLFIPGRMASVADWLADAAGGTAGIAFATLVNPSSKVST